MKEKPNGPGSKRIWWYELRITCQCFEYEKVAGLNLGNLDKYIYTHGNQYIYVSCFKPWKCQFPNLEYW